MTLQERFDEKVERIPFHSCWEWTGATSWGYGQIRVGDGNRRLVYAHRYSYSTSRGPIPEGLQNGEPLIQIAREALRKLVGGAA